MADQLFADISQTGSPGSAGTELDPFTVDELEVKLGTSLSADTDFNLRGTQAISGPIDITDKSFDFTLKQWSGQVKAIFQDGNIGDAAFKFTGSSYKKFSAFALQFVLDDTKTRHAFKIVVGGNKTFDGGIEIRNCVGWTTANPGVIDMFVCAEGGSNGIFILNGVGNIESNTLLGRSTGRVNNLIQWRGKNTQTVNIKNNILESADTAIKIEIGSLGTFFIDRSGYFDNGTDVDDSSGGSATVNQTNTLNATTTLVADKDNGGFTPLVTGKGVNQGDTSLTTDYFDNPRNFAGADDIGAVEVQNTSDTQRSKTDLQQILLDNTTGEINEQDVRDVLETNYGKMFTQTVTGDYLTAQDEVAVKLDATSNNINFRLPTGNQNNGRVLFLKRSDNSTNLININVDGSDIFEDGSTTKKLINKNDYLLIIKTGTVWFIMSQTESFFTSFDNSDLISNTLLVNHDLGQKYVNVAIYNDIDKQIIPTEISAVDDDNVVIDLNQMSVSGIWNLIVTK